MKFEMRFFFRWKFLSLDLYFIVLINRFISKTEKMHYLFLAVSYFDDNMGNILSQENLMMFHCVHPSQIMTKN